MSNEIKKVCVVKCFKKYKNLATNIIRWSLFYYSCYYHCDCRRDHCRCKYLNYRRDVAKIRTYFLSKFVVHIFWYIEMKQCF